ncbi:MAG: DUF4334 domain-containing protein [Pseudanabaenaceae cyanobacterium bins.39]|nr:DUF4334 domain-containing protein [Pseudanabaenaceae cyanobacterium bins.39]
MTTFTNWQLILETGKTTTPEALQLFDSLEPVDLEFMMGKWRGSGLDTSHPMDGLLEASDWYGKEFIDPETVHPLIFLGFGNKQLRVAPDLAAMKLVMKLPLFKRPFMKPLLKLLNNLLSNEQSQARLRMTEYRNKVSATMIYDRLPINDSFRKIDADTVLGLMDFKGLPQPFFFVLRRDKSIS